jgi:hypothetical protein
MDRSYRKIGVLIILVMAVLLPSCRGVRTSPEEQVRTLIRTAAVAAEQKNIGTLRDLLSEQYTDDQGQNKRAIESLLRLQFLRNENIYLYTQVQGVTLPRPDQAQATVLVAMAGTPIVSVQDLPGLRADLYRFEIEFTLENKTWRVQRAAWRRAELSEFLTP